MQPQTLSLDGLIEAGWQPVFEPCPLCGEENANSDCEMCQNEENCDE